MSAFRATRRGVLAVVAATAFCSSLFLVWYAPVTHFSPQPLAPELRPHHAGVFEDALPNIFLADGAPPSLHNPSDNELPSLDTVIVGDASSTTPIHPLSVPQITFIAIWSPRPKLDVYLPNFFASIAANPSLELLLIKIDKYDLRNGECERVHAAGVPGVREVCIPMDEYYELHLDYLCSFWSCSQEQREKVREAMVERFKKDKYNSSYRPFRAEIFKKWMRDDVKLWGWCDLDIMLGNFDRTFPWDLADDFDVFVAGAPTEMDKVHLFMPGHMTVFRHAPDVAGAFFDLEEIASVNNYLDMPWILRPQWDGPAWHHLSTLDGVFGIWNAHWMPHSFLNVTATSDGPQTSEDALTHPVGRAVVNALLRSYSTKHAIRRPTFSDDGVETEVTMRDDLEISEGFHVWYNRRYAVLYLSTLESISPQWRKDGVPARRQHGGSVVERFEPLEQVIIPATVPLDGWIYSPGNRPWIQEALYIHYQGEKYQRWYGLPQRALKQGDVLYIDRSHGVHVWDAQGEMYYERIVYVGEE
ncbi:hypothetical protein K488DRAFT_71506 [Vararia minispora EC-137]|uniref:Uncharacterized protein n=1 Tax=Vararia minispora EC-137 TaxID=1314806 RepID=A0ACB8QHI7_9AGAM|nr:hypothetical protein K488DRAFT_71506 [Vararia minispora EC-137]